MKSTDFNGCKNDYKHTLLPSSQGSSPRGDIRKGARRCGEDRLQNEHLNGKEEEEVRARSKTYTSSYSMQNVQNNDRHAISDMRWAFPRELIDIQKDCKFDL